MSFTELFGMGSQATIVVALISLMGASVSIAFAMAMAIHYLDEPIASKRQIVLVTIAVLIGFSVVLTWPDDDEPIRSLKSSQHSETSDGLIALGMKKSRTQ